MIKKKIKIFHTLRERNFYFILNKQLHIFYDLRSPSVQSNKFIPTGNSAKTHVILNCMVKKKAHKCTTNLKMNIVHEPRNGRFDSLRALIQVFGILWTF